MHATADSKIVRVSGIAKAILLDKIFNDIRAFPNKDMRRWPAMRLAVRRTHKVIGRIIFLTSSIMTINIIKVPGVPWGTKWDNMWFVFFNHPNSIKESQNVKDKGRVTVRWEVGEKICG